MPFFDWAAPLFGRFGDRWSPKDLERIAGWLRPYVPEGGLLLDLGGGTGALAAHLAESLRCRVTVLDATARMLDYLPQREDVSGLLGRAEAMPFGDDSFDAVVVSDALHHFRDLDGVVREMQRVVRCGGGVLVLEYDPSGTAVKLAAWGEKLLGEPAMFFTPEELCRFMAKRGIEGDCEAVDSVSYRFVGTVRLLPSTPAHDTDPAATGTRRMSP